MKNLLTLFTYCTIFTCFCFAQKLEVTYQESVKVNPEEFKNSMKVSVNGSSGVLTKEIFENVLSNMQEPKDFLLKINNNETFYNKIEKIDNQQNNGVRISMSFGDSGDGLYKNLNTREYLRNARTFDKAYTIKDKLIDYNWQLTRESKKIIGFDVKKATAVIDSATTVTAWYAPSIAIKDGPGVYTGLPGLILEIEVKDSKNKSIESSHVKAIEVKEVPNLKSLKKPDDKNAITNQEFKTLREKAIENLRQMSTEGVSRD